MSNTIKKEISRDEIRIGEHAAAQPVSGTHIVLKPFIKGYSNMAATRTEEGEAKKAHA